jgi:hypothetical protein
LLASQASHMFSTAVTPPERRAAYSAARMTKKRSPHSVNGNNRGDVHHQK